MKHVLSGSLMGLLAVALSMPAFAAHGIDKTPTNYKKLKSQTVNFNHASSASLRAVINKPVPNFAVQTLSGKGVSKTSFKGKMALFVLADTQCPCVLAIENRVKNIAKRYGKNLRVSYVFSMPKERPIEISRYMHKRNLPFTPIIDSNQRLLKLLDGRASSEVYLLDAKGVLRYHGRVDDSTFDPKSVKSRDLENAIQAVLRGKKVARPEVPAMGCSIPRI